MAGGQSAAQGQTASPAETAVSPDEVVMTIGERKITAAEFEQILTFLPPQFSGMATSMGKRAFAEQYGNLVGLAIEGEKRNLDENEQFRKMMEFQRVLLLGQMALNDVATSIATVSPDEVRYYYTANATEFEQVKVRGIYIPYKPPAGAQAAGGAGASAAGPTPSKPPQLTEEQARLKALRLRSQIRAGEDMAALAKAESDHPTAAQGGDFGYVRHAQFTQQIDGAIFSLPLQQVSAPVKDRFGYFIFRAEEKRTQPFEEAQPIIESNLRQHKLAEALAKLKAEYPVVLNPRYFPEAAPASPSAPPAPTPSR